MTDLEEIKQRVDIVSFIGDYISLKKAGRNFKGLCPFHGEKTPSFVVSPDRQIWHCFGSCGVGGDIFSFLMKIENIEFPEALQILAKKAGVNISRSYQTTESQKIKEEIYNINRYAKNFYNFLLTNHKIGKKGRDYLQKRGINEKIIKTFALGYAPDNWDSLTKFLIKKGFDKNIIVKAGLALFGRSGTLYDRFRGRIIFTLFDHRGNIIGFSGRKLPREQGLKDNKVEAKYINSPETPVYIKGNTFYGLNITLESIKKENTAIIVEGEFDLLSSFQAGVSNVVAIKGTALTENQANLIKRYTDTIAFSLDSDKAGLNALVRGIEVAERHDLNIKVILTPLGKDPDECIKESPFVWKKAVSQSITVYDFLLDHVLKKYKTSDPYDKKKIVNELTPLFARIKNSIVQSHYISILSQKINVSEDRLIEVLTQFSKNKLISNINRVEGVNKKEILTIEEYFLALLLQFPPIWFDDKIQNAQIVKMLDAIDNPGIKKIIELFINWIPGKVSENKDTNLFIKTLPEEYVFLADKAYLYQISGQLNEKDAFEKEFNKTIRVITRQFLRRKIAEFTTTIRGVSDETQIDKLNSEINNLKEELKKLDNKAEK